MNNTSKIKNQKSQAGTRGFTLVEMIVAVALFAVVMLVCVGALLSLVNANRKAQALQSVMNNLNIALDGTVRAIREGSAYNGSVGCTGGNLGGGPNDCTGGSNQLSFQPYCNSTCDQPWVYTYDPVTKRLYKSVNGQSPVAITSPEVSIDDMEFYVVGTTRKDPVQPKIVIVINGSAGAVGSSARTTFHIQATAVQRLLDL